MVWYVEWRLDFDWEDRIGWSVVPVGLLLSISLNAFRHLALVLLVPDKRGARTVAGSLGLGAQYFLPASYGTGAVTYVIAGLLGVVLASYLARIGWNTIRGDLRHPGRSLAAMLAGSAGQDPPRRPTSGAATEI